MRRILIEELRQVPVSEHQVEIVERKGKGHPDYICDAIMERISQDLNREYIDRFGDILHNNIDKGLLVAGQVKRDFGGGKVIKPMRLYIGDRATFNLGGSKVPVKEIAIEAAKDWIKGNLRFVDPDKHIRFHIVLGPGSEELTDIFQRQGKLREANDTSAAVGYAPLTETEGIVLEIERYLNSSSFKDRFPETGEDVKVMGFRGGRRLHLTVAMPLLCRYIEAETVYFQRKALILEDLSQRFCPTSGLDEITFSLNALDREGRGLGGVYLSLLGTSAEDADSGQVGRGNRVNGVIPLNRPVSAEAAAGKNPVSHVGKIYNILAHRMAEAIYRQVMGLQEVYVWLLSQIGTPIDQPRAAAQLVLARGVAIDAVAPRVKEIMEEELNNLSQFCRDLAQGCYPVC